MQSSLSRSAKLLLRCQNNKVRSGRLSCSLSVADTKCFIKTFLSGECHVLQLKGELNQKIIRLGLQGLEWKFHHWTSLFYSNDLHSWDRSVTLMLFTFSSLDLDAISQSVWKTKCPSCTETQGRDVSVRCDLLADKGGIKLSVKFSSVKCEWRLWLYLYCSKPACIGKIIII